MSPMTAPYAITAHNSRGRQHAVVESRDRNEFRRDYTRVLHSQAFRRLQQKTQVFSANLGDLFRTRMTHSLEVDQISQSIARALDLNEDLCGVLAIGHDIGHAPFGHMGQDLLNDLMKDYGGFEHNLQALRLVDEIESPYPEHKGLNLMFETREGLLKHCTRERALELGEVAARHLDGSSPFLEAQVVDYADAIAYVHADLEDAFTMGVLALDKLYEAPGFLEAYERIAGRLPLGRLPTQNDISHGGAESRRVAKAVVLSVIRDMMTHSIADLVHHSRLRLDLHNPQTPKEARVLPPLVGFGAEHQRVHRQLKAFSRENIYTHESIASVRRTEEKILRGLFAAFATNPSLLPSRPDFEGEADTFRRIADHISGMTDRFAVEQFHRILKEHPGLIPKEFRAASQAEAADPDCYPKPRSRAIARMGRP